MDAAAATTTVLLPARLLLFIRKSQRGPIIHQVIEKGGLGPRDGFIRHLLLLRPSLQSMGRVPRPTPLLFRSSPSFPVPPPPRRKKEKGIRRKRGKRKTRTNGMFSYPSSF